ncbi:hypothetical protein DFJ74DRAFT_675254 [Hyaloraphidium curvatum]|nr:hypothetical protein DFJ74DRAFT_675254 [Hyaloraphidium curvatum]
MHRSDTQQSLDVGFAYLDINKTRQGSTASTVQSLWASVRGKLRPDDTRSLARTESGATFSSVLLAEAAAGAAAYQPEALASLYLPPSVDGSAPLDSALWNACCGSGTYSAHDVPADDFRAGIAPGPNGGGITAVVLYTGVSMKADAAVAQGMLRQRPQYSLRVMEELENHVVETARKMESSMTLQGSSTSLPGVPLTSHLIPRGILRISDVQVSPAPGVKLVSAFCVVTVRVPGIADQRYTSPTKVFVPATGKQSNAVVSSIASGFVLDIPMAQASIEIQVFAFKVPRSAGTVNRLGSFFKGKASPAQPAPQEPALLGTFRLTLGKGPQEVCQPSAAPLELADSRTARGAVLRYAAMYYMDQAWIEPEEAGSDAASVVRAEGGGMAEMPPFAEHLTIMTIHRGKPNWRRYWAILGDGVLKVFSENYKGSAFANNEATGILPISRLLSVSPPDGEEHYIPSAAGMQLSFASGEAEEDLLSDAAQKAWAASAVQNGQMLCFADARDKAAQWAWMLGRWQPDCGVRGFEMGEGLGLHVLESIAEE